MERAVEEWRLLVEFLEEIQEEGRATGFSQLSDDE
jgi:hypothetical protein